MSLRFPPSGDSRYTPRDRSPPPRFERRGSNQHGPPGPLRNSDNSYRPGELSSSSNNARDVPGAPRGPRESMRGGSYAPRGRGYGGRDSRDSRDNQFFRRDSDRDFSRRDTERRSPGLNRNRSRTPPTRDYRDSRDGRDLPPRSLDMNRVSRDSRDNGPLSATSVSSDSQLSAGGFHRGSFRRGRGDWDRGRGRGNFSDDRDSFNRVRSRSRERWDRDYRDDRSRDHDRDTIRRDEEKWDRDRERFRGDPPVRPDSRNSIGSHSNTSNSLPGGGSVGPSNTDRFRENSKPAMISEGPRRSSFAQSHGRPELNRNPSNLQPPSSPMQFPQVPEFGTFKPPTAQPVTKPIQTSPKDEQSPNSLKPDVADPIKMAPKGPKADLNSVQPPTAPKNFPRGPQYAASSPVRPYESHHHHHHPSPSIQSPSTSRFGPTGQASYTQTPSSLPRIRNPLYTSPELANKSIPPTGPTTTIASSTESASRPYSESETPTGPSSFSPSGVRIPTEPKAARQMRPTINPRSSKPSAITWVNPRIQQKPSILQPLNQNFPKKEDEHVYRSTAGSPGREVRPGSQASTSAEIDFHSSKAIENSNSIVRTTVSPAEIPSAIQGLRSASPVEDDEDVVDEDDDSMVLNQDDFDEQETQFQKKVESLRSRLTDWKKDPKILFALETIDVYASAIEDLENGYVPPPEPVEEKPDLTVVNKIPAAMPTPPSEALIIKDAGSNEDAPKDIDVTLADLPLDGLTYLEDGYLTPKSFAFSEDETMEESLCERVKQSLALVNKADEELREEYANLYRQWREEVELLDEEKARQEAEETRAPTPLSGIAEPAVTPVPESGRRSGRNATERDLEKVIALSAAEAAVSEALQAPPDMSDKPDYTREAVIPDMLSEEDQQIYVFQDLNNLIPNGSWADFTDNPEDNYVFKALNYFPPKDDFTEEEQECFKDAYALYPKKWGYLATHMNELMLERHADKGDGEKPRPRDFHECILHYYLTKKATHPMYKTLPGKRGKGRRKGPRTGPRTRNLLLNVSDGVNDTPVRMTDTGRPKRAAAPSFDNKEKKEAEAQAQAQKASSRRNGASLLLKPTNGTTDGTQEKPPARRGRQANKDKTAKRGAKGATNTANASPSKKVKDAEVTVPDIQMQDVLQSRDLEGAHLLAEFSGLPQPSQPPPAVPFTQPIQPEEWRVDRLVSVNQPIQAAPTVIPSPALARSVIDPMVVQPDLIPPQQPQQPIVHHRQMSPQGPPLAIQNQPPLPPSQPPSNGMPVTPPTSAPLAVKQGQSRVLQNNSYWSVHEEQHFKKLIQRHGHDWAAISQEMPVKTETMVSTNF
jgi:hypothetical protein